MLNDVEGYTQRGITPSDLRKRCKLAARLLTTMSTIVGKHTIMGAACSARDETQPAVNSSAAEVEVHE